MLEVAQYAINNGLAEEPAFAWWVPYTIRKRDRIIKAMKSRYMRINQKYGIEIPKTVEQAKALDQKTGTTYWMDAIRKEMKNCAKAFEILPEGSRDSSAAMVASPFSARMESTGLVRMSPASPRRMNPI